MARGKWVIRTEMRIRANGGVIGERRDRRRVRVGARGSRNPVEPPCWQLSVTVEDDNVQVASLAHPLVDCPYKPKIGRVLD